MERNKGSIIRGKDGYKGEISIEGVIFDIMCTFWSNQKPNYIWLKRIEEKKFDEKTNTFSSYTPKPFFECYAYKTKRSDIINYRGQFMFVGFKYDLMAWFEDKTEKKINIRINRSESQPILKRLNELNKEKYK